jgi:uncharacterized protein with PIN domain
VDEAVAVKHPIESLGAPHPEVEWIVANGRGVGFEYQVGAGDRIEVYPAKMAPAGEGVVQPLPLRPPLEPPVRFVLDTHLGQLAAYLRLLGFDSLYRNDYDDATLAEIASAERRVLLTRDRGLLKRKIVVYGYSVRQHIPKQQVIAVLRRYELLGQIAPWRRCLRCNGLLHRVAKEAILDRLEPKTRLYYNEFHQCEQCSQVYWQGAHYERMQRFLESILREIAAS